MMGIGTMELAILLALLILAAPLVLLSVLLVVLIRKNLRPSRQDEPS